jgi:flagellar biosynthesis protein FlhB
MGENENKTEQASPKKRANFRDEGKIAVSREVISIAVLLASATGLLIVLDHAAEEIFVVTQRILGQLEQPGATSPAAWLGPVFSAVALAILPPAILGNVGALASGFAQTGGLFSSKKLQPSLSFLNPLPKLRRMLFSKEALLSLLMATGKVGLILALTTQRFLAEIQALSELGHRPLMDALRHLGATSLDLGSRIVLMLAVFAALDYVINRRRIEQEMKMTKEEVKEEHRQHEGDPEVRRRLRTKMREIQKRGIAARVRAADVVLVNPTHYAVALRYDTRKMRAPQVCAKGEGEVASTIREIARRSSVPVLSNPPLARALYAEVKVGHEIPSRLYTTVAEVLAFVYRLRGKMP